MGAHAVPTYTTVQVLEQITKTHGITGLELIHYKYDELAKWHGEIHTRLLPQEAVTGYLAEDFVQSDKILIIYQNKALKLFVIVSKVIGPLVQCPHCPSIGSKTKIIEHIFDCHRKEADETLQMYGASHLPPIEKYTNFVEDGTIVLEEVKTIPAAEAEREQH